MPTDSIQSLIAACRNALVSTPDMGAETKATLETLATRFEAIVRAVDAAGDNATEAQNKQWEAQLGELQTLLTAIQQIGDEGPTDPAHEMYKDYASSTRIYVIGIWAIVFTIAMIVLAVCLAHKDPGGKERLCGLPRDVACALPLVAVMGALGGFLTCIQSFGRYVGNRQFLRSWTLYYFLFPLKGSGLAIIVFFLVNTNLGKQFDPGAAPGITNVVTLPATLSTSVTTNAGGQSITNISTNSPAARFEVVSKPAPEKLNLVTACLIAALTGMFANQAIEMLAGVFAVVFKKVEGKDVYQDNQTKGAAPTKPAAK